MTQFQQDVSTTQSLGGSNVPPQVLNLAEQLAKRHGRVVVTLENRGYHLYMASPKGLEMDGSVELTKRHLAVNASLFLGLGKFGAQSHDRKNDAVGFCMKYRVPYTMYDLLHTIPPLSERGIDEKVEAKVICAARERKLQADGNGNMIPPHPGKVVPLPELPDSHPAIWYLKIYRGYDIDTLYRQFRVSWCVEELSEPERRAYDIFYMPLPAGFASTPQGRIIFYADIYGVQQAWQGRIPEFVDGNRKFYWHPYNKRWMHCETREHAEAPWTPIDEIRNSRLEWKKLPKYKTADYTSRSEVLFGFDAAVEWNRDKVVETTIISEGPLDAGRVGPPAVCMVGSFFSEAQAALVTSRFRRIWIVADKDNAGKAAAASVMSRLAGHDVRQLELPESTKKDLGDLSQESAKIIVAPAVLGAHGHDV